MNAPEGQQPSAQGKRSGALGIISTSLTVALQGQKQQQKDNKKLNINAFAPAGRLPRANYNPVRRFACTGLKAFGPSARSLYPHLADEVSGFHGKLVQAVQEDIAWSYQPEISTIGAPEGQQALSPVDIRKQIARHRAVG